MAARPSRPARPFWRRLTAGDSSLFILDWVLPDTHGIQLLHELRATCAPSIPVLFVTQMDKEEDVILALETGADDYMTKPVKPLEMLARITALGRRAYPAAERVDTHVSRIRNKLGLHPENGWNLSAIYQHGYRLERLAQSANQIGESRVKMRGSMTQQRGRYVCNA